MDISADDLRLLNAYVATKSHDAFGALVARHIGLVHAAALRRVGNADLAEDVTQAVFMILAGKAGTIRQGAPLPPWLYKVTRYTSANALKMEKRRQHHERLAGTERPMTIEETHETSEENQILLPMLDAAIDSLGDRDRTAVLLRFFEGLSYEQVAASLDSSAHAAEVRVSRAVEKLRRFFAARNAAVPSAALTMTLAARSGDAAPALVGPVTAAALGNSAAGQATTLASATLKSLAGFTATGLWAAAAALLLLITAGTAFLVQLHGGSTAPAPASGGENPQALTTLPATRSVENKIDVPSLVRKVRQDESWIDHVQSFHITVENDKGIDTPEGLDSEITTLNKEFPQEVVVDKAPYPKMKAQTDETTELAFDQRRKFTLLRWSDGGLREELHFWDGQKEFSHEIYPPSGKNPEGQENYYFGNQAGEVPLLQYLPWARASRHYSVWQTPHSGSDAIEDFGSPEDYILSGRKDFRGHDCYVLDAHAPRLSLYIGAADQRLYGITEHVRRASAGADREFKRMEFGLAADLGHVKVSSWQQLEAWFRSLSPEEWYKAHREENDRRWKIYVTGTTFWYEDYKEIAPGCWMPMFMGFDMWSDGDGTLRSTTRSFITGKDHQKVVSVSVNQPLADDLFIIPAMTEGAQASDSAHDPPLTYKFKKDMTAAEWEKVLTDGQQREQKRLAQKKAYLASTDPSLRELAIIEAEHEKEMEEIGKPWPAPAFGQSQWLNSKPLAWSDLKGKVVILYFFAEWWEPCRNDLPRTVEIDKHQQDSGVVVIGIHPPGSDIGKIQKLMQEFQIAYPVYIDLPFPEPEPGGGLGLLYGRFGVNAIPDAFLIDPAGNVVDDGALADISAEANQLAAKAHGGK